MRDFQSGYNKVWLVDIILNHGQVPCHQFGMDLSLSENDLNPWLQVKNAQICLNENEMEREREGRELDS